MIWDRLAAKYDKLWVQKYSLEPTRRELLGRIQALKAKRLLDIGCGTGQLIADVLAATEIQCVGIDKSGAMIEAAKAKNLNAEFYTLDIAAPLPEAIRRDPFDVITCTHSLPYYENKKEIIHKIAGLMNEETILFFVQASVNHLYDGIVMYFIEKTAEKAEYLSKTDFLRLTADRLCLIEEFSIKEKWFMPSICGYAMKLKDLEQ
ncbi:MAG: class I SAM-dependent methyltransferase [Clostridiales bacterium]